jgi:lipopolysaccharide transport system permease protein
VSLVDFAVSSVVLVGLMLYFRVAPTSAIVMLPVVVLIHVAFTAGVALLLSMGNLFYRDVKYLFELVITVWMFASTVLYPAKLIGGKLAVAITLNPMTPIIDAYRAALIGTPMPNATSLAVTAAMSIALLCGAWVLFHRSEFEFAESL